jgi:effector-binding domain-containing protein
MRIVKYIFLLLLLAVFATSVYVATQKGDFDVSRTAIIKSPRTIVFNYVNDYRNWETFASWEKENPGVQFNYGRDTSGKGASYSWTFDGDGGDSKTVMVRENESISQKMNFKGSAANVQWTFKDTVGGTKVTWRSKGQMGFNFKIHSVFQGGPDRVIGNMFEKSLANLDKTLDYELKTYNIKVNGIVQKIGGYYLKQTITSKISDVPKNLRIMMSRLVHFFAKNKIVMNGKPFVLYHTYDSAKGITRLSVCIPLKEEIFVSEGSDVSVGKLSSFTAVKTTLKGDYSHLKSAWDKTFAYIDTNHLTQNPEGASLELYSKGVREVAYPSQWVTEIYIPIQPKVAVPTRSETVQGESKPQAATPKPTATPATESPAAKPVETATP